MFCSKVAVSKVEQQVVDIELYSLPTIKTAINCYPGSKEMPTLAKSKPSDRVTIASVKPSFSNGKVISDAKTQGTARDSDNLTSQLAQVVPMSTFLVADHKAMPASSGPTKSDEMQKQKTSSKESCAKMPSQVENKVFLEEVYPPEMIELVDNNGDQSLNVWQPGGHSSGGSGQRSDLMDYLKDLNRRIKSLWSPPGNDSHVAEVLFRIRKTGQLAFLKVLHTSGSADVDESILKSITAAAPFKPLPGDYPNDYLDVKYTFNYKVDGLAEVSNESTR